MSPFDGIVVQMFSGGQMLRFYDDPDGNGNEDDFTSSHYIEATTGSTFSIKVSLNARFNFHNLQPTDGIHVAVNIGGQSLTSRMEKSREELQRGLFIGQSGRFDFDDVYYFSKEAGQWMRSDLTFAELKSSDSANNTLSVDKKNSLGRIQITLQRVQRKKCGRVDHHSMSPEQVIKEVPEKAIKGQAIANTVAFTNTRPAATPAPLKYTSKILHGEEGKAIVYNVFYRSRNALQMLGCISRSPTPAFEPAEIAANNTVRTYASQDVKQEVQALRARLALLERDPNIKNEGAVAVKREAEEGELADSCRRPRKSARIETIDLTGV